LSSEIIFSYLAKLVYWHIVAQMKLASVKLAMKYMKRVSAELETGGGGGPEEEELIVQGVRYAFRVHQVKTHLLVFLPLNKLYLVAVR